MGLLLDRQDILDCLTRFSRGMDRFDPSDALGLDALAQHRGDPLVGPTVLDQLPHQVVNFVLGLVSCHHGFPHGDCAADQSL